jgi:hypothetical protein
MMTVAGVAGSVTGLVAFLSLLALQVLPNIRGPVLGDSAATAAVLGCLGGAALFVGSWVIAASAWRSISLYRKGKLARGVVERISTRGEEDSSLVTVHWHIRTSKGRIHPMRSSLRLPRGASLPSRPAAGDSIAALHHEDRIQAAQPVGLLGLERSWHIAPVIQPPAWFNLFRLGAILLACVLLGLAVVGLTANRTLDPGFLKPWTWIVVGIAVAVSVPLWLGLRRFGPWLRGQTWGWLAAGFLVLCLGTMGAVSAANVWFSPGPSRFVRTRVIHLDEEYFPGWHQAAFVRSWRAGRIKERIPLHWRMGLSVFPGDELVVEVSNGALGWPVVGEVRRR